MMENSHFDRTLRYCDHPIFSKPDGYSIIKNQNVQTSVSGEQYLNLDRFFEFGTELICFCSTEDNPRVFVLSSKGNSSKENFSCPPVNYTEALSENCWVEPGLDIRPLRHDDYYIAVRHSKHITSKFLKASSHFNSVVGHCPTANILTTFRFC